MKLKIEQMRKQRKISKFRLSKLSGVSVGYIAELENGIYQNPGIGVLCKLCKVLNCTLDELVDCE